MKERVSKNKRESEHARAQEGGKEREKAHAREKAKARERERKIDGQKELNRLKKGKFTSRCEREKEIVRIGTGWGSRAFDSYSAVDSSSVVPVLQCVAVFCSVLQCVAACCSVLQCVAACCSACVYVCGWRAPRTFDSKSEADLTSVAPVLQCDAM